jgi:DNA-binding LacI/PurR family transcriptional regulator
VLPALRERSVAIPSDLSVIWYEDWPLARRWHLVITVIDNNARQMGEFAGRVVQRLERPSGAGRSSARSGRTWLIERDSCPARR